ncbi:MAG: glycoside hydrolase family 43 protein [Muribaculaceae bacterium]|nr:glycoside hydrolase family 43 protein [Muribaculaceae bacterium]
MRKLLSVFYVLVGWLGASATIPIQDINIRDPFILTDSVSGNYYMYSSRSVKGDNGEELGGVAVYKSTNLSDWDGPIQVCTLPSDNWITGQVWALEVHRHNGKYYLFATINSDLKWKAQKKDWPSFVFRGTQIFQSDSPEGPFEALNRLPATPIDEMALDGTLWVEDGVPYMVYCQEWVQTVDGLMKVVRMSDDLSETIGEPVRLFNASAAKWSTGGSDGSYVTDGCFLYRTKAGKLLMIWSSFMNGEYAIGIAESTTGKIMGPWKHIDEPLFNRNGGHGMLFKDFDGGLHLVIHVPNSPGGMERARIFDIEDTGHGLQLKQ